MKSGDSNALRRITLNHAGVSLVETMVALGLFALCAAATGRFLTHQIRTAASNQLSTKAYALAEQELETVRMQNYDDMLPHSATQKVGSVTYTLATTVVADQPARNMKTITVDVSWTEPMGTRNVTLYTIYTSVKR